MNSFAYQKDKEKYFFSYVGWKKKIRHPKPKRLFVRLRLRFMQFGCEGV